jgi:hypothetical protein
VLKNAISLSAISVLLSKLNYLATRADQATSMPKVA